MVKILFFLLTINFSLNAQEKANDSPNEKKNKINEKISTWLDRQTRAMDLALAGKTYTNEYGDSDAVITQEAIWNEIDGFNYRLDFDLHLALPNFEKKYKFMISNYNSNRVRRSNYSRGAFRDDRDNDYGATLSFFEKIGEFDVSFEPRLRLSGGFGTYYNLRFENKIKITPEKTRLKNRFEFFADSIRGTGQFVSFTLESELNRKWATSFIFEEEYQDADNVFILLQGFNILCEINKKMLLNTSVTVESSNRVEDRSTRNVRKESFRMQEIVMGPSFTHKVLTDEVHYSVNYSYIWNREQSFRGFNSASFILSLIF